MLNRRSMLSGLAVGTTAVMTGCAHGPGAATTDGPTFAVTIDDFRFEDGPILSGAAKHRAILDAMSAARVQAAGLITGKHIDNDPARGHLAEWSQAGHAIGNHTYSHAYYGGSDPGDLGADIDRAARCFRPIRRCDPGFASPIWPRGERLIFEIACVACCGPGG